MRRDEHSVMSGIVAGALAGLCASYAMNRFQEATASVSSKEGGEDDDPTTVKAAERVVGHPIPKDRKPGAGEKVHYSFGALLGAFYGTVAEIEPRITAGFGLPYGAAVAAIGDEAIVPALGLSGPPWKSPFKTHAYSVSSHLVFGVVLEAARRALRSI